jgi:hypothetical protein
VKIESTRIGRAELAARLALVVAALLGVAGTAGYARTPLSKDAVQPRMIFLDDGWVYTPGDDPAWAKPAFDDRAWHAAPDPNLASGLPGDWPGVGWFRLRFTVAPDITGRRFRLQLRHLGTSDAFLDGALVDRYGSANDRSEGKAGSDSQVVFREPGEYVLAVRYVLDPSAHASSGNALPWPGIAAWLEVDEDAAVMPVGLFSAIGFAGSLLVFGVLYLAYFLLDRSRAEYGYFSCFAFAVFFFVITSLAVSTEFSTGRVVPAIRIASLGLSFACFVAFLFKWRTKDVPSEIWVACLIWTGLQIVFANVWLPYALSYLPMVIDAAALACVCVAFYFVRRRAEEFKLPGLPSITNSAFWILVAVGAYVAGGIFPRYQTYLSIAAGLAVLATLFYLAGCLHSTLLAREQTIEERLKQMSMFLSYGQRGPSRSTTPSPPD